VSWKNSTIPTTSDIRAEQRLDAIERERDFWLKKAESLQRELENIWDNARDSGRIELHHRREMSVLVVESPPAGTEG
jgi:hypothetical protein